MLILKIALSIILMMSVGAYAAEELTSVDEVIARYIDALGGRQALESKVTRTVTGTMVTDRRSLPLALSVFHAQRQLMTEYQASGVDYCVIVR